MACEWTDKIFAITSSGFEALALEIFRYQYENNTIYRAFSDVLEKTPGSVHSIVEIPFLPISLFKTQKIVTGDFEPALVFESSGTTGMVNSLHYVKNEAIYQISFERCFQQFYGRTGDLCILALLPTYLERMNSSLVYMTEKLISKSGHRLSGFYLEEKKKLAQTITSLETQGQKTLLIGVSFALLDLAEEFQYPLKHVIIMETGGMKGRREEITRLELHERLKKAFGLERVHSEYGMTELLSQAYSKGEGIFRTPPWMRVLVRDDEDPLLIIQKGAGIINVIDLANVHSCSFIATDDAGKIHEDGSFEVLGRVDNSDIRGCSLLVV